jgi:lipopolysaccharide O-acetyltransferase
MLLILKKIQRNLSRPIPELYGYLKAKLISFIWKIYIDKVGPGFHICAGTRLEGIDHISFGNDFHGGPMLWIEAVHRYLDFRYDPQIRIGNRVNCSEFVHITATHSVIIGDDVLIGSSVHITDHSHGRYTGSFQDAPEVPPVQRALSFGRAVHIENNVWLGDGVVVLPGVTIGAGSIIGANSVVSKDIPAGVIAVGSPALPIKKFDVASQKWQSLKSDFSEDV